MHRMKLVVSYGSHNYPVSSSLLMELHLWGASHQWHLWWVPAQQLWHIRSLSFPTQSTATALSSIIIYGETLISCCLSMLLFSSKPPYTMRHVYSRSCWLSISTELGYRQSLPLPGAGITSGALWCQPQKLAPAPVQSLEILTHRETCRQVQLPLPALPHEQKKTGALPLTQGCFL